MSPAINGECSSLVTKMGTISISTMQLIDGDRYMAGCLRQMACYKCKTFNIKTFKLKLQLIVFLKGNYLNCFRIILSKQYDILICVLNLKRCITHIISKFRRVSVIMTIIVCYFSISIY